MATILEVMAVPDGVDYQCLLTTGERHCFHAVQAPPDAQIFVDNAEAALLASLESPYTIIDEEGAEHG